MYKSLRSPFSTIKHVIPSTDPSVRYILSYIQSAVCGHSLFSLTFLNALPWNRFKYCQSHGSSLLHPQVQIRFAEVTSRPHE